MNLKKLYTKCGVHSGPLLLFRKFDVFHTFSVFLCCRFMENVWKNSGFLKSNRGLLCPPDLVCSSLSSLVTFYKGKVTNMFN